VNGLEAILQSILNDAKEQASQIVDQASERRSELLAAAEREAATIADDASRLSRHQSDALRLRAESMAALDTRRSLLAARQALIDRVLAEAAAKLTVLPDAEKVAYYRRQLLANARGDEQVIFNAADKALAGDVIAGVNQERGWRLSLAPEAGGFAFGLVLDQGLVQINLTSALLFREQRQELVSLAARVLFDEQTA
jgi:V/A-type H+/Na+-transporting ATPase subunit E